MKHRAQENTSSKGLLRGIVYTILAGMYMYVSSSILIFHGPWNSIRDYAISSIAISRHADLLRPLSLFTLSNKEIRKYSQGWTMATNNVRHTKPNVNFRTVNNVGVTITTIVYPRYKAWVVEVRNPNRVSVQLTKHLHVQGETVEDLTADANGILGINGGAFADKQYRGTGGIPLGTTITNGKFLQYSPNTSIIGLTAEGQLVCGVYTKQELKTMHVTQAVAFGPILIQDGKVVAPSNDGWAPRVAIGQRKDGAILFVVTDGRGLGGANDVGATYTDVSNILMKYGAITAANLDGGSSTTLVYKGDLLNTPADVLGERLIATAFVVK